MRLSLNGWPPIASHVGCLLVGMALTHLTRAPPPPRLAVPPGSVALALGPGALDKGLARGVRVELLNERGGRCRIADLTATVIDPAGLVAVALTSRSSRDLAALAAAVRDKSLVAVDTRRAGSVPLCRSGAKVVYGAE